MVRRWAEYEPSKLLSSPIGTRLMWEDRVMDQRDMAKGSKNATAARRPYEKPRIVETGAFEHLVLACARTEGDFTCLPPTNVTS